MGWELLDVSGDAGVRATGATLREAIESAASGMYSLITDPGSVREQKDIAVKVESHSAEGLLVGFLNELIYRFDAHGFIGRSVEVKSLGENSLEAVVRGEDFDPARHGGGLLLKAATYHGLRMERQDGGWLVEVIFDI